MFHCLLSRNSVNDVQNADADLRDLLKGLHEDGLFRNTIVAVMADHGHRFSELRATQQDNVLMTKLLHFRFRPIGGGTPSVLFFLSFTRISPN